MIRHRKRIAQSIALFSASCILSISALDGLTNTSVPESTTTVEQNTETLFAGVCYQSLAYLSDITQTTSIPSSELVTYTVGSGYEDEEGETSNETQQEETNADDAITNDNDDNIEDQPTSETTQGTLESNDSADQASNEDSIQAGDSSDEHITLDDSSLSNNEVVADDVTLPADTEASEDVSEELFEEGPEEVSWSGPTLNRRVGRVSGPSGSETYYNLNMHRCVSRMQSLGYDYEYWVRDDGVKMFGDYIMCAADFSSRPLGTVVETSLGTAIVVDTGDFVKSNSRQLDIAVTW